MLTMAMEVTLDLKEILKITTIMAIMVEDSKNGTITTISTNKTTVEIAMAVVRNLGKKIIMVVAEAATSNPVDTKRTNSEEALVADGEGVLLNLAVGVADSVEATLAEVVGAVQSPGNRSIREVAVVEAIKEEALEESSPMEVAMKKTSLIKKITTTLIAEDHHRIKDIKEDFKNKDLNHSRMVRKSPKRRL